MNNLIKNCASLPKTSQKSKAKETENEAVPPPDEFDNTQKSQKSQKKAPKKMAIKQVSNTSVRKSTRKK